MDSAAAKQLNQFEGFLGFKPTWVLNQAKLLPHTIVSFFTGNQACKTSTVAYMYVLRIFGWHPVPQKNVLFFECEELAKEHRLNDEAIKTGEDYKYKHPWVSYRLADGSPIRVCRQGTFVDALFYMPQFEPNPLVKRPEDNICPVCGGKVRVHERRTRIMRFASEKLPTEKDTIGEGGQSMEINNTQYPEFKKWLPHFLIKKDITMRNTALTLYDPNHGAKFGDIDYVGNDIVVEFVAFQQSVQAQAGVQRMSTWIDEHAPLDFFEEQFARLLTSDGDFTLTLTPAMGINWEYDDIFEKASLFLRTDAICDFLSTDKKKTENVEFTDSDHDIAVIQAATDDNPTLSWKAIERKYAEMPDPDGTAISTRRYGVFKQASGRIFKDFNYKVHIIDPKKYGLGTDFISSCVLARTFDFHTENNHAILWAAISDQDEVFLYKEWSPSPGRFVMETVCNRMAEMSNNDKFVVNLIDRLASSNQANTGKTTIQEMNESFYKLTRKGKSRSTVWTAWDPTGEVGRDEIKKRLQNSLKVGKPLNNIIREGGITRRLPTLWVFNSCKETAKSLKHWRLETWASNRQLATKDRKETPTQKFSHFCTALEALFKRREFRARKKVIPIRRQYNYFNGRR